MRRFQFSNFDTIHRFLLNHRIVTRPGCGPSISVLLRHEENRRMYDGKQILLSEERWRTLRSWTVETFPPPSAVRLAFRHWHQPNHEYTVQHAGYKQFVADPPELLRWTMKAVMSGTMRAVTSGTWRHVKVCLIRVPVHIIVTIHVADDRGTLMKRWDVSRIDESGEITLGEMLDWLEELHSATTEEQLGL